MHVLRRARFAWRKGRHRCLGCGLPAGSPLSLTRRCRRARCLTTPLLAVRKPASSELDDLSGRAGRIARPRACARAARSHRVPQRKRDDCRGHRTSERNSSVAAMPTSSGATELGSGTAIVGAALDGRGEPPDAQPPLPIPKGHQFSGGPNHAYPIAGPPIAGPAATQIHRPKPRRRIR